MFMTNTYIFLILSFLLGSFYMISEHNRALFEQKIKGFYGDIITNTVSSLVGVWFCFLKTLIKCDGNYNRSINVMLTGNIKQGTNKMVFIMHIEIRGIIKAISSSSFKLASLLLLFYRSFYFVMHNI